MMADYTESPVGRISGVGWAAGEFVIVTQELSTQSGWSIQPLDQAGRDAALAQGAAFYQTGWRGVDSGAEVDLSNVPDGGVSTNRDFDTFNGFPTCTEVWGPAWTALDGGPPDPMPSWMYAIAEGSTPSSPWYIASGFSRGSYHATTSCVYDFNPLPLNGWIHGETVKKFTPT